MAYRITFTPRFQKHFKDLTAQEKKLLKSKLELLAENPAHPSLRTKRIQGTTDLFECSVNMDIRIIWYYEGDIILRIHDEMCQPLDDIHTASISRIVSEAYRKRSLPSPPTTGNASSTPQ